MASLAHITERGVEEFKRFSVMFLYLWVVFALFLLYKTVILHSSTLYQEQGFALFNALVLAKVMLVAEDLKLGGRFERRPMIYPILFKAAAFAIVFIVFHTIEKLITGAITGKDLSESMPRFGGGTWGGVIAFWAILAVTLIPFFAIREISRELGADRMWAMMFRRDPPVPTPPTADGPEPYPRAWHP